ncbi:hypothetical protein KKA08_08120, partial [bacterium]|nr:hypothetical protein [bacterium]
MQKSDKITLLIIFFLVASSHGVSPVMYYGDVIWYVPTALSIIHEGNTDLDEFVDPETAGDDYKLEQVNGHWYTVYPIGVSLIALPFVALFSFLAPLMTFPLRIIKPEYSAFSVMDNADLVGMLSASFIVAISAVFI